MKRTRSRAAESHGGESEFLWLMSLSDLMLLLFVFFVVLFSFTYQKLTAAELKKIASTLRGDVPVAEVNPLDKVQESLAAALKSQDLLDAVEIVKSDTFLRLEIKEKVLFESADYRMRPASLSVMRSIAGVLAQVPSPYRLGIEGHTDNVPIRAGQIADNWDLSSRRALAVLHALELRDDLLQRTVIMGYADKSPLVPNADSAGVALPENQSKNRRVTLKVFR